MAYNAASSCKRLALGSRSSSSLSSSALHHVSVLTKITARPIVVGPSFRNLPVASRRKEIDQASCFPSFPSISAVSSGLHTSLLLRHSSRGVANSASINPEAVQEAVRKHREIQNLLSSPSTTESSSSSSMGGGSTNVKSPAEVARQQRYRQAIVNSTLSFFVVILAAQGVKNGHEKRQAQEVQHRVEVELQQSKALLRQLASESFLLPIAQECADAIRNDTAAQQQIGWTVPWLSSTRHAVDSKDSTNQVDRVLHVLTRSLSEQVGPIALSEEEKELQAMTQLVFSSTNTTTLSADSAIITDVRRSTEHSETGSDATSKPKRVFVL